nr:MAG TPA: terminase large subunit [Caudoviricetes sp.]
MDFQKAGKMRKNALTTLLAPNWRLPERIPPWKWCEENVKNIPYSPIPGHFKSANSPWVREVMEAMADPDIRLVSIVAPVQSSKTISAELCLCYVVANFPGPCLWLSQTDSDAKDQAEARLHKLFSECDAVKKLFPADRHKKKTQTVFFSNGMTLWVLGAHAKSNLQSRSIRWLIGDETWQWPSGHMQQAEARVTAFGWLGKCIFLSQGGMENDDTHRKFETTDMREWEFKCPKCGKYQPYKWSNIEWDRNYRDGGGQIDFAKVRSSVRLVCEFCKHEIADSDANRKLLNSSAKFVPQNPNAPTTKAGFHWNSLASMSWGELAEMYLRAKESCRRGDMEDLKNFYQKRLALPWGDLEEDFTLDISPSGYRMGDDWESEAAVGAKGAILQPPHENKNRVRLRFLTVDVQMDHFYAVIRSWACDASSRLVYCAKLQTWEDVEILQNRFGVFPQLVFVDAGYSTFEVYRNCAKHNWTALMGDGRRDFPHRVNGKITQRFYSTARHPLVSDRKCRMHYWSNLGIKDTLARLRSNQNPGVGSTWEVPSDAPEEYLKMLDSEQRVKKGNSWEWRQIGKRPNHYWDCEAMQVCAAYMMKLFRVD